MRLRLLEILQEKRKTKYWLYIQLGLGYQNFNKIVNNEIKGIKFETLKNFVIFWNVLRMICSMNTTKKGCRNFGILLILLIFLCFLLFFV